MTASIAGTGPRFEPGDGHTDVRVRVLETWASRHDEFALQETIRHRAAQLAADRRLDDHDNRLRTLYQRIGEVRVRLGVVLAVASVAGGIVSAIAVALVSKWIG